MCMDYSRRKLLKGMGAAGLALPFYNIFGKSVHAQESSRPRNLMIFFSPNGVVHSLWRPQVTGEQFQIGDNQVLTPLRAHRDDLILIDGLDFLTGNNHEGGMAAILTTESNTKVN